MGPCNAIYSLKRRCIYIREDKTVHTERSEQFVYGRCGDLPLVNKHSVNFITAVRDVRHGQLGTCIN